MKEFLDRTVRGISPHLSRAKDVLTGPTICRNSQDLESALADRLGVESAAVRSLVKDLDLDRVDGWEVVSVEVRNVVVRCLGSFDIRNPIEPSVGHNVCVGQDGKISRSRFSIPRTL